MQTYAHRMCVWAFIFYVYHHVSRVPYGHEVCVCVCLVGRRIQKSWGSSFSFCSSSSPPTILVWYRATTTANVLSFFCLIFLNRCATNNAETGQHTEFYPNQRGRRRLLWVWHQSKPWDWQSFLAALRNWLLTLSPAVLAISHSRLSFRSSTWRLLELSLALKWLLLSSEKE